MDSGTPLLTLHVSDLTCQTGLRSEGGRRSERERDKVISSQRSSVQHPNQDNQHKIPTETCCFD